MKENTKNKNTPKKEEVDKSSNIVPRKDEVSLGDNTPIIEEDISIEEDIDSNIAPLLDFSSGYDSYQSSLKRRGTIIELLTFIAKEMGNLDTFCMARKEYTVYIDIHYLLYYISLVTVGDKQLMETMYHVNTKFQDLFLETTINAINDTVKDLIEVRKGIEGKVFTYQLILASNNKVKTYKSFAIVLNIKDEEVYSIFKNIDFNNFEVLADMGTTKIHPKFAKAQNTSILI